MISPGQLVIVLAAFLLCAGWIGAVVTHPGRERGPVGEAYGWVVLLTALFVIATLASWKYVAPELDRWLR